jgi:hypothetical protein
MTSAFILPDITLHQRKDATTQDVLKSMSASHDISNCSVCQRILSASPVDLSDLNIPAPIPVTERATYKADVDATLRPSQPPSQALARVMKELTDELQHLKLEFAVLTSRLRSSDPALGKRATEALHRKIGRLNHAILVKGGQLYALYDVCEAHKVDFVNVDEGEDLPEDVERTLERVTVEREKAVGKKHVGFDGQMSDGESEWPGISDTEGT